MQIVGTEELLRELPERVVVSEAGACMVLVDKLAGQKARSQRPVQSSSAVSSRFATVPENMASKLEGDISRT